MAKNDFWHTEISIQKSPHLLDHKSKVTLLGSCFTENIGNFLQYYKFPVLSNPFGTLYNPIAIFNLVERSVYFQKFTAEDIFLDKSLWQSFWFHSKLNHIDKSIMLSQANAILQQTHYFLKTSDWLFLTFGTAWVYQLKSNTQIVANCHKQPQSIFKRYLLTLEECIEYGHRIMTLLKDFNPKLQILFTVSPVRHLRDGMINNQRSKSILLLAIQHYMDKNDAAHYFPAYEIMMDDLRDYRFYQDDLLHPNELAIKYIWGKFQDTFISDKSLELMRPIERIQKSLGHRPFFLHTPQYQDFLTQEIEYAQEQQKKHPDISFSIEINQLQKQLQEIRQYPDNYI